MRALFVSLGELLRFGGAGLAGVSGDTGLAYVPGVQAWLVFRGMQAWLAFRRGIPGGEPSFGFVRTMALAPVASWPAPFPDHFLQFHGSCPMLTNGGPLLHGSCLVPRFVVSGARIVAWGTKRGEKRLRTASVGVCFPPVASRPVRGALALRFPVATSWLGAAKSRAGGRGTQIEVEGTTHARHDSPE